jgi:hypothetical protein
MAVDQVRDELLREKQPMLAFTTPKESRGITHACGSEVITVPASDQQSPGHPTQTSGRRPGGVPVLGRRGDHDRHRAADRRRLDGEVTRREPVSVTREDTKPDGRA